MLLMQLTAAHGPAECEHAVLLTLRALQRACERDGIALEVLEENATPHGYQSLLLRSTHPQAAAWFAPWLGTIQTSSLPPAGHRARVASMSTPPTQPCMPRIWPAASASR